MLGAQAKAQEGPLLKDLCFPLPQNHLRACQTYLSLADWTSKVDSLYEDIDIHTSITLACFGELCWDLFRQTYNPAEKVLHDSKIDKSFVNNIVLILEAISAMVLGKMKQTAEAYLSEKVTMPSSPSPPTSTTLSISHWYPRRSHHPPYCQRNTASTIAYSVNKRKNSSTMPSSQPRSPLPSPHGQSRSKMNCPNTFGKLAHKTSHDVRDHHPVGSPSN
ncbi:70-kilodalton heat shock protein [Tulasnella sp. 417]|nr:70-kilodalton heat shock protein [Tulasnella sp. 417]